MYSEDNKVQKIPKRILSSLISSVSAGVVPRAGAPYIAIGRTDEISALLSDLEAISEGDSRMRFLIGRYGSGKSFLIQLIRGYALERNFLCADADLSPERRLYGSNGTGVATYRELMKNLASKSSPDGAALTKIISRFIENTKAEIIQTGISSESAEFRSALDTKILGSLRRSEYMVGGFDFAKVVTEYYNAFVDGDDLKMSACVRWLRGEYSTKTEAKKELGFNVSVIIDDDNWYDFIKLWAFLARIIGYRGLVVFIDECVNLYKIPNRISRENNYEKILSMFNDTLQGRAPGLCCILGGTPQFLEDSRRGLFSYEALRSRLCDSRFASVEYVNLLSPVIRLRRLTDEELFALIYRITSLYEQNYNVSLNITEENILSFLKLCLQRAGADTMITPREMLRDYITVLNILMQNKGTSFETVVGTVNICSAPNTEEQEETKTTETKKSINLNDLDF